VWDAKKVMELREIAFAVPISYSVQDYAVRLVVATQPTLPGAHEMARKYLRYGASPRGVQALTIGGKVRALRAGRPEVAYQDIRDVVLPTLRHRIIVNFEGAAEGVDADDVLKAIVESVPQEMV
jgi:MoxR-like ATPase